VVPSSGQVQGTSRAPAKAKALCGSCPVRTACLEWAIQAGERAGIWSGATPPAPG
jgi:hypothetical protein